MLQQIERIRALVDARRSAYAALFEAIVEEERELADLYAPIKARIDEAAGSLSKLSFSVRRNVDLAQWAAKGEDLLDLRTNGPFKGRGELLRAARAGLMAAWATGDATQASTALLDFVKANEAALRTHMPENAEFRAWARNIPLSMQIRVTIYLLHKVPNLNGGGWSASRFHAYAQSA